MEDFVGYFLVLDLIFFYKKSTCRSAKAGSEIIINSAIESREGEGGFIII